jgi:hypothetical protein
MTDVSRREVMRALGVTAGMAAATVAAPAWLDLDDAFAEMPDAAEAPPTPARALARWSGNRRFDQGQSATCASCRVAQAEPSPPS